MPAYSKTIIQRHLDLADAATTSVDKGKAFEDLIAYLFGLISGLSQPQRNRKNVFDTEEIDLAFWNEEHRRGLPSFGNVLLIECKYWSAPVGSRDVNWFITKIRNRGLKFGILVAASGITGSSADGKESHDVVSKALADGIRLIVIDRDEIEGLGTTDDLVGRIQEKVCQLVVSGTIWP